MKSTVIPIELSYGISHVTVFYKDVKRLILHVKKDKIIASVPKYTSKKTIEEFILKNVDWIEKHLVLDEDNNVNILGKVYSIEVVDGRPKVELTDSVIKLFAVNSDPQAAKKTLLSWWKRQAKEYFLTESQKVYDEVKEVFSLDSFPKIIVSSAHSYWGKCFYQKNVIKLSYYLYQADPDTIKYVIYHEFCHLKYYSHDKAFYEALAKYYPDVKGAKKQLKGFHSKLWFDAE